MNQVSTTAVRIEKKYRWLPLVFIGLLGLFTLLLLKLYPDEKSFSVVRIPGKNGAINFSKAYHLRMFQNGIHHQSALLAEEDDWIGMNDYYFRYHTPETDTLRVDDSGDSMILVNGKIHALIVEYEEELLPFFRQMNKESLRELETIFFRDSVPLSYLPYLETIARQYPTTSLVFEDWEGVDLAADYRKKAGYFSPRYVSQPAGNNSINDLSGWNKAECLYLNLIDSVITNPLPPLPAMNQCIIYSEHLVALPANFFSNNPQLRKVSLLTDKPFFSVVKPLEKPDELVMHFSKGTGSVDELSDQLNQLSVLMISGPCTRIELMARARKLKWIGFPVNTSQETFNEVMGSLKKLQVAGLPGSKSIRNYSALQQLPDLRGLIITDTVTDISTISSLKKLRYLSVPMADQHDSTTLLTLEKALPGCIIVANSGACVGSGWMLLLLPVVIAFTWFRLKYKTVNHADTATD